MVFWRDQKNIWRDVSGKSGQGRRLAIWGECARERRLLRFLSGFLRQRARGISGDGLVWGRFLGGILAISDSFGGAPRAVEGRDWFFGGTKKIFGGTYPENLGRAGGWRFGGNARERGRLLRFLSGFLRQRARGISGDGLVWGRFLGGMLAFSDSFVSLDFPGYPEGWAAEWGARLAGVFLGIVRRTRQEAD